MDRAEREKQERTVVARLYQRNTVEPIMRRVVELYAIHGSAQFVVGANGTLTRVIEPMPHEARAEIDHLVDLAKAIRDGLADGLDEKYKPMMLPSVPQVIKGD